MKERSGKDSNVEFQSGTTKKSTPVAKPKPRPKVTTKLGDFTGRAPSKDYTNQPIRKPMQADRKLATTYTGKVYNPEPKAKRPTKNLPLSGKQKRMDKGRSRLNPFITYGETKKKCEEIISEFCKKNTNLNSISLRYFNPIGAHKSALIGELPNGVPQNLVPYITQTAIGLRKELTIFGSDYPTRDGTCIRDYIHVMDLAEGHVKALEYLFENKSIIMNFQNRLRF